MPSSSLLAHRMRNSGFTSSGLPPPSVSSFIDGLSPHPSVHTPPFLPSTPPPLVHGLERHPTAPKMFPSSLFLDSPSNSPSACGQKPLVEESSLASNASYSSQYSVGSSRFMSRSRPSFPNSSIADTVAPSRPLGLTSSAFSASSTNSSFSSTSSRGDVRSVSPFDDPLDLDAELNPIEDDNQVLISLAEEEDLSECSTFSKTYSEFALLFERSVSPVEKSPPTSAAISRVLMEYLNGLE